MYSVELYNRVRRARHVDGMNNSGAARVFGIDRKTVAKFLKHSVPPGYRRSKPLVRPKLDPFIPIIDQILEDDKGRLIKQRHTAKLTRQCAAEGKDHVQYLLRLCELELIERERRMIERRIKAAKFPATKSLDSFDFTAIPSLNKALTMELARCEFADRRENVIALGPSGTGKTHSALGLGLVACQKGLKVRFTTAAALVHELVEAVDERRLQRLQKTIASQDLLIIDELGFAPLSKTGAELLFETISRRYERGSITITSNLPFEEWTETFGTERLTGALLDRLTHHVNILEMNGESYRLAQSRARNADRTP